ncbi:MAG: hypothetical protein ACPGO7_02640 [Alphaproteobacteria bacterium]
MGKNKNKEAYETEHYDSSDIEQVQKREEKAKLDREQQMADLLSLLQLPAFRRFIVIQLQQCHVGEAIFTKDSRTFYNAGKLEFGNWLIEEIRLADPESIVKILNNIYNKGDSNV